MSFDTQTKDLRETITDTREHHQNQLDMFQDETRTIRDTIIIHQGNMELKMEATRCELRSQLEEIEARAERGSRPAACASAAQSPTFDLTTSWAVFQRQFETVAEHNCCTWQGKYTYLTTALQGRAADVLHGISRSATYEETLHDLKDRFGDQHCRRLS
jgi:benzoyl-CoA reductase/2-hydroxyglutaryl-CoA dehydratase subunit BcrC/BadD/HgdB